MAEKEIGSIVDYFTKVGVAALKLTGELKVGDTIHIKGATTDLTEKVNSMQTNHKEVTEAKAGDDIGLKVSDRVRRNDKIFLVE